MLHPVMLLVTAGLAAIKRRLSASAIRHLPTTATCILLLQLLLHHSLSSMTTHIFSTATQLSAVVGLVDLAPLLLLLRMVQLVDTIHASRHLMLLLLAEQLKLFQGLVVTEPVENVLVHEVLPEMQVTVLVVLV